MRLGVISDSHRDLASLERAVEHMGEVDMLLHAGDLYTDAKYLENEVRVPVISVIGNCDFTAGPLEEVIAIGGKKILLTHGHNLGVKSGLGRLGYLAEEKEYDAVVFGHSHVPCMEYWGKVLLFNPGSVSLPRGTGKKTFGILNVSDKQIQGEIFSLEK